jgi:hypothetical protein
MQDESSASTGQTANTTTTCSVSTVESTALNAVAGPVPGEWTSSAEASPAKTSPSPARARASKKARAQGSGPNSPAWSVSFDHATCSWRTCQPSEAGDLTAFSGTWPRAGTMRNGSVSQRPPSEHHSAANASWLLPTLTAREGKDWSRAEVLARLDRGDGVAKRICALSQTLRLMPEIVGLSPCFAEWLMGFPLGWTDCAASGTL